jgi:hypothetical protein
MSKVFTVKEKSVAEIYTAGEQSLCKIIDLSHWKS